LPTCFAPLIDGVRHAGILPAALSVWDVRNARFIGGAPFSAETPDQEGVEPVPLPGYGVDVQVRRFRFVVAKFAGFVDFPVGAH
jgi:hypothetical protein